MSLDRAIMAFAGVMIIISILLTKFVHPDWFWLTVFIGFNLFQSAFTGFCPAGKVMAKLGFGKNGAGAACGR